MHCAARSGNIKCIKYIHNHICPWNNMTCDLVATSIVSNTFMNGHLHCLKYLHEHGCPWNQNICTNAAYTGHLDCLRYAIEHQCPGYEEYLHHLS
jgi:hypothetical protein